VTGGPADPYACVYSWADLLLMWEIGRSYIPPGLPEAIDDARTAAASWPPPRTYEERVRERLAEMEQYGRERRGRA
jgi:hypothetical protein